MNLIAITPEVYRAPGPVTALGRAELDLLREVVASSARGRVRINLHPDNNDPLHEMFIAIRADSYIRPHRHAGKSESFHLVEGEADVVVFDETGNITHVVTLGGEDGARYYRLSAPLFHTLVIHSPLLIVHETTNGPFAPDATEFAAFAPADSADPATIASWQTSLMQRVRTRP